MSGSDEFERVLDELIEAGVFEQTTDGGLRATDAFRERRAAHRETVEGFDDGTFEATVAEYAADSAVAAADVAAGTLADAMAVFDVAAGTLDRERCLLAALALDRLGAAEREGVPEGFVALDADDIDEFVRNQPAAVVYFWREDCPPCDGVRENFETLRADGEIPDSMALAAVYGPDAAALIQERYDVGVAPTTLFCVGGEIDSRIVGNPGYDAFRMELETVAESMERA